MPGTPTGVEPCSLAPRTAREQLLPSVDSIARPPALPDAGVESRRAGGLLAAAKGHMTPCFALLTLFLVVDVAFLVVPFHLFRFTDDPWGSASRMGFLARAMASALAFGLVAAIAAERRNHSQWFFAIGHLAFPVA